MLPGQTPLPCRMGRIVAVGNNAEVTALRGADTSIIDLQDAIVLPGILADAHDSGSETSSSPLVVPVDGSRSAHLTELLSQVRRVVNGTAAGTWVVGKDWPLPTSDHLEPRDILDQFAPHHPVFLRDTQGELAWVNSKALRLAEVDEQTEAPANGTVGRHPTSGRLRGTITLAAIDWFEHRVSDAAFPSKESADDLGSTYHRRWSVLESRVRQSAEAAQTTASTPAEPATEPGNMSDLAESSPDAASFNEPRLGQALRHEAEHDRARRHHQVSQHGAEESGEIPPLSDYLEDAIHQLIHDESSAADSDGSPRVLTPGEYADMTVIDQDWLELLKRNELSRLHATRVSAAIFDGDLVHNRQLDGAQGNGLHDLRVADPRRRKSSAARQLSLDQAGAALGGARPCCGECRYGRDQLNANPSVVHSIHGGPGRPTD